MKSAVEWLETRAEKREKNNPNESAYWHLKELQKDFEQAKQMEVENKKKAYIDGGINALTNLSGVNKK